MTATATRAKLADVKLALARKHENLAKVTKSKPRQKRLMKLVDKFRRQANDLSQKH